MDGALDYLEIIICDARCQRCSKDCCCYRWPSVRVSVSVDYCFLTEGFRGSCRLNAPSNGQRSLRFDSGGVQ